MKNKIFIILIFSFILSLVGFFVLYERATKVEQAEHIIKLDSSSEAESTFDFSLKDFYPGKNEKVDVLIISKDRGDLDIEISFKEKVLGELKEYINVKIYYGSEIIEKKLSELLDGESIFIIGSDDTIIFEYHMDVTVGNEAQGTESLFNVTINISK